MDMMLKIEEDICENSMGLSKHTLKLNRKEQSIYDIDVMKRMKQKR